MEDTVQPHIPRSFLKTGTGILFVGIALILFCLIAVWWYVSQTNKPSPDFPVNTVIEIAPGMSVTEIATELADKNVVRSELFMYFVLVAYYDPTTIKASNYVFSEPQTTFAVAKRLTEGDFSSDLIRFTHREGERASHIAEEAEALLIDFDKSKFLSLAEPLEGMLFPDTYFIPPAFTAEELVDTMHESYQEKMAMLADKMAAQRLPEDEIVILASILEREANSEESMRMVSGILHNRLAIGMPLQVDATMEYVLDKPLAQLTPEDLERDTPYNTYKYPGLPPTAIGNPGETALLAALEPESTDYYFYITDEAGDFYYAKTFDEHRLNIAKYLR